MNIEETIDRLAARLNSSHRPDWVHITALPTERGPVLLTVELLHPLGTVAASDEPQIVAEAVAKLFDDMAAHARCCVASEIKSGASHPLAEFASAMEA